MPGNDDDDDPKVKDLLEGKSLEQVVDEVTRQQLERWFAAPSFTELEEQGKPARVDEDMVAVQKKRADALAAVDPALVADITYRVEENPEKLRNFEQKIDVHVDPDIASFDLAQAERAASIAEPREVEISEELRDDLKECVPQALLRDLHRPETDFAKTFEIVDFAAEQRLDAVAEVDRAMKTSWALPPLGRSPFLETRDVLLEVRRERRRPWPEIWDSLPLPNRKVSS